MHKWVKILESSLYVERHEKDDIIRYSSLDSYPNLIFKTHAMLAFQQTFCVQVSSIWSKLTVGGCSVNIKLTFRRHCFGLEARWLFYQKSYWQECCNWRRRCIFAKLMQTFPQFVGFGANGWFFLVFINNIWRYVPSALYPHSTFPEYCSGGIYVLTTSSIGHMLANMHKDQLIRLEDVFFTGILREQSQVQIHSSDVFCTKHVHCFEIDPIYWSL